MGVPTLRKSNIHLTTCPDTLREQNATFFGRLSLGSVDCQCKSNLQGKLKSGELKWEVFPSIMTWYPRKDQSLVFIVIPEMKLVQDHPVLSNCFDQISCSIAMASINVHIPQQNYHSVNFQFKLVIRQARQIQRVEKFSWEHGSIMNISNCINAVEGVQISWDPFHHLISDLINNFVVGSKENSSLEVLDIPNMRFKITSSITSSLDGWHILEAPSTVALAGSFPSPRPSRNFS